MREMTGHAARRAARPEGRRPGPNILYGASAATATSMRNFSDTSKARQRLGWDATCRSRTDCGARCGSFLRSNAA